VDGENAFVVRGNSLLIPDFVKLELLDQLEHYC